MPNYAYADDNGHKWTVFKWYSQIDREEKCDECGQVGHRIMAPHLIGLPRALQTEERYIGKRPPR